LDVSGLSEEEYLALSYESCEKLRELAKEIDRTVESN